MQVYSVHITLTVLVICIRYHPAFDMVVVVNVKQSPAHWAGTNASTLIKQLFQILDKEYRYTSLHTQPIPVLTWVPFVGTRGIIQYKNTC